MQRRQWLKHVARTSLALATVSQLGLAQAETQIRLLVGFPAGGGTDAVARLLASRLQSELSANIVVDNRPGAGGQIAAQALKAAVPDGRTFFITHDHTISILPKVIKEPGFDPAQDFEPVAGFATFVNAFAVSVNHPAQTLQGYIDWVKTQDDSKAGAVGIPAPASTPEFLVATLSRQYKTDLTPVPYRGSAPMIADMLGNQIHAGIGSVQDFMEYHRTGRLRVLGVLGTKRQAVMPEVPTFDEIGIKGFEDTPFYGIYAPKGIAPAHIKQCEDAVQTVLAQPDVQRQLQDWGMTVQFMTHQQLSDLEAAYSKAWSGIISDSGFAPL